VRIALATCEPQPVPDTDAELLVPALEAEGVEVSTPAWTDQSVDWGKHDLVMLSSTWDYHEAPDEFRRWLRSVDGETLLENSPALIEWNLDKRYLRRLDGAGVSIIPTIWADPGNEGTLERVRARDWTEFVVKPTVDLGALNLIRTGADGLERALGRMDSPFMIQPFLPSLESDGELSMVFMEGELTHALRKRPVDGDFRVQPNWGGTAERVDAPSDALEVGNRCLAAIEELGVIEAPPLYARVDLVRGLEGESQLIELELIEPLLFLVVAPDQAEKFAAAILRRAAKADSS
jgi:hypothetical protein